MERVKNDLQEFYQKKGLALPSYQTKIHTPEPNLTWLSIVTVVDHRSFLDYSVKRKTLQFQGLPSTTKIQAENRAASKALEWIKGSLDIIKSVASSKESGVPLFNNKPYPRPSIANTPNSGSLVIRRTIKKDQQPKQPGYEIEDHRVDSQRESNNPADYIYNDYPINEEDFDLSLNKITVKSPQIAPIHPKESSGRYTTAGTISSSSYSRSGGSSIPSRSRERTENNSNLAQVSFLFDETDKEVFISDDNHLDYLDKGYPRTKRNSKRLIEDTILMIDVENLPNIAQEILSIDLPSNFYIYAFVGKHHPQASKLSNVKSPNFTLKLSPSTRKDGTDTCMQIYTGAFLYDQTYEVYLVCTRDHFGGTLVEFIESEEKDQPWKGKRGILVSTIDHIKHALNEIGYE